MNGFVVLCGVIFSQTLTNEKRANERVQKNVFWPPTGPFPRIFCRCFFRIECSTTFYGQVRNCLLFLNLLLIFFLIIFLMFTVVVLGFCNLLGV